MKFQSGKHILSTNTYYIYISNNKIFVSCKDFLVRDTMSKETAIQYPQASNRSLKTSSSAYFLNAFSHAECGYILLYAHL